MSRTSLLDSPVNADVPARANAPRRWPANLNWEGVAVFAAILLAWQFASLRLPPFLFPSFAKIGQALLEVLTTPDTLLSIAQTWLRILLALAASFALALVLGIVAGFQRRVDRSLLPLVQFLQGVPAVCWVIFAVIWFKNVELRIAFVVVISTFAGFYYQIREGVRAVPPELTDMVRALRPSRLQLIRKLILPSLAPAMLTAWRSEIGAGTKITIMAELLGGISGVGYRLRLAQELFRMDQAIAWSVVLIAFVLIGNAVLGQLDRRLLRWRQR